MQQTRTRSWRLAARITPAMRTRAKIDVPRWLTPAEADVVVIGERAARAIALDNHPVRPFRLNIVRRRAMLRSEP